MIGCLDVDAIELIEATPGAARGQTFEELPHLAALVQQRHSP